MSAKTSAAASPLTRLARLAARLPTPANLYAGVTASDLPRPDNIVLFTRTSARQLRDGSHTRRQHHHHRHVLLVNLGASGTACIDQHLLPGRPGQALLIHPHQFHHFRDIAPAPLRWLFITFELPPPGHLEGWRGGWRTLDERALALLGELLAAWERPPSPQAVRLVAATLGLLLLRLSSAAASAPAPAAGSVFLKKTNALIEASPGRMLTVKTLAGSLHMSESHARRLFREETSLSLGHYLRERRIARAMTLLRSNAHPDITAVGEACGFGSLYSFSRAFRKATSLSPRSYASRTVGRGV